MQRLCMSFVLVETMLWPLLNLHVEHASDKVVQKRTQVKNVARMVLHSDSPCAIA